MSRKPRLALLDPVEGVAYSRPLRRGGKYVEDCELQAVLYDRGIDGAREFASRRYGGVVVAVFCGAEGAGA